jgi:hypothetical protein
MAPILGIYASSASPSIFATSYESIATATPSGVTTITFSSIPSTYTHLQLRLLTRTATSASDFIAIRFNGDTASNYTYHYLEGNGSSAYAGGAAPDTVITWNGADGGDTANTFNACVFDILDYANTNKFKTARFLQGHDLNGSGLVGLRSGLWRNTSAINSITVLTFSPNFATGSSIALYGIKG